MTSNMTHQDYLVKGITKSFTAKISKGKKGEALRVSKESRPDPMCITKGGKIIFVRYPKNLFMMKNFNKQNL